MHHPRVRDMLSSLCTTRSQAHSWPYTHTCCSTIYIPLPTPHKQIQNHTERVRERQQRQRPGGRGVPIQNRVRDRTRRLATTTRWSVTRAQQCALQPLMMQPTNTTRRICSGDRAQQNIVSHRHRHRRPFFARHDDDNDGTWPTIYKRTPLPTTHSAQRSHVNTPLHSPIHAHNYTYTHTIVNYFNGTDSTASSATARIRRRRRSPAATSALAGCRRNASNTAAGVRRVKPERGDADGGLMRYTERPIQSWWTYADVSVCLSVGGNGVCAHSRDAMMLLVMLARVITTYQTTLRESITGTDA